MFMIRSVTPVLLIASRLIIARSTSFPILLLIAFYERQAKKSGSLTFYETISSAAEKIWDTFPRSLKRLC